MNFLTPCFRRMLCVVCLILPVMLCACSTPPKLPPRYKKVAVQPDPRVPRGQPIIPTIGEGEVRQWFSMVSFPHFKFDTLSHEFHPDDGNLLATYKNGPRHLLYLSYVDNVRMSRYAFPRSAEEIVSVGKGDAVEVFERNGWTWFAATSPLPIMAVDVTPTVKVVLVGYEGVPLKDLTKLAATLPLNKLAQFAASGPRSKL